MVTRATTVPDLEVALATQVSFMADPDDTGWYRGGSPATPLYLRLGNFPDEPLYSLYLGHGRWMDFTTAPDTWTVITPEAGWPDTARPRLPKGQFHE
ncbi:hypothetical protein [Gordonia insulae]|uniref:Uncharacterized protein n=1 Tax=Gordonia insulae TaxID=2420509 RepID=A0A3G8JRU3_9ACTN|nr:hypothetical protein [Gordonia insulae]AZG47192.1 hypothetical protein D7316_03800 [Gordonia insulae]